jgi:hypothetical protein
MMGPGGFNRGDFNRGNFHNVDGNRVGSVSQFISTTHQPLELAPGRHHVEIRAGGYHRVSSRAFSEYGSEHLANGAKHFRA